MKLEDRKGQGCVCIMRDDTIPWRWMVEDLRLWTVGSGR